jgi:hypothetical protein
VVLSPRGRRGLNNLRPERLRAGDDVSDADLLDAGVEVFRRRLQNTDDGGDIFSELRARGWSVRQIAREVERRIYETLGLRITVSHSTIDRWSDPPGQNDPPDGDAPNGSPGGA